MGGISLILTAVLFYRLRRRPAIVDRGPLVKEKTIPTTPRPLSKNASPVQQDLIHEAPDGFPRPRELDGTRRDGGVNGEMEA